MLYFMGTKMNEIQILPQNFSSVLSAEEQLLVFKNDFPHFHRIIKGGLCIWSFAHFTDKKTVFKRLNDLSTVTYNLESKLQGLSSKFLFHPLYRRASKNNKTPCNQRSDINKADNSTPSHALWLFLSASPPADQELLSKSSKAP